MAPPRVLIADDHTLVAESLRTLLSPHCEVVGLVEDGREVGPAAERLTPDVVILDISMPGQSGLEAARELLARSPGVRVIFLTMHEDPALAAEAMELGAAGYLLKSSAVSELRDALRKVQQGETFVTSALPVSSRRRPVTDPGEPPTRALSPRQREVLALLATGLSMKQVAHRLGITSRTVAYHKYEMMKALGLTTSAELIRYAVTHGLVGL